MGGGDAPLMDPSICSSFGSLGRPSTFEALPEGLEQALPSERSGGHRRTLDVCRSYSGDGVVAEARKTSTYYTPALQRQGKVGDLHAAAMPAALRLPTEGRPGTNLAAGMVSPTFPCR